MSVPPDFFALVASKRDAFDQPGAALTIDPVAVLTGFSGYLAKRAGWSDERIIDTLVSLAGAGRTKTAEALVSPGVTAAIGAINLPSALASRLPKLNPAGGFAENAGRLLHAAGSAVKNPTAFLQGGEIATHNPQLAAGAGAAYNGDVKGMLSAGYDALKTHAPQAVQNFLNSDFIKQHGTTILAGLGTAAATKLMGGDLTTSLGAGAAGAAAAHFGPKLYEGLTAPKAPVAPEPPPLLTGGRPAVAAPVLNPSANVNLNASAANATHAADVVANR